MITVTFLNGCILATAEQSLWQYSYNQQLQINGLELPGVFTVDFCNEGDTTTVAMIGSSGVVDIPNELLTSGRDIVAYVFQKSTLTGGITRCEIRIDVLTRPERDDETPTPEQEAVIDQYIAELNEGVETAETAAANAETSENNAAASAADAQQSKADAAASASAAVVSASDASNSAAAAAQSAVNASNSAEDAAEAASEGIGYKEDSEAWAIGKRGGVDVGSSDETYHNNSKYYASQAAASSSDANSEAAAAAQSARDAAASANGAAQSAASATASKNAATNSADVAANAATAAQNHAISAASSATAASGSATAAANKATAAAQSATAAGNSATEAATAREAAEDAQDAAEAAQAAAEAVLASIPSDYSELSEDVDDLKSQTNKLGYEQITIEATNGKYVNANGGLSNGNSFAYTASAIPVKFGDRVVFTGRGYSTTVAMIYACDANGENRTPLVMSTDDNVHDFAITFYHDGYIGFSWYRWVTPSAYKISNEIAAQSYAMMQTDINPLYFQMGNINVSGGNATWNATDNRVRSVGSIYLRAGDIVGLSDYTDARYNVIRYANGSYIASQWYTTDKTLTDDGEYYFNIANLTDRAQNNDPSKLADLFFIRHAMSAQQIINYSQNSLQRNYGNITSPIFANVKNPIASHRGLSAQAPENTIPAFELAGNANVWGIETDIIELNDGTFVCFHDTTLDRMTDGSGDIRNYTYAELQNFTIDAGAHIEDYPGLKIPKLEAFLRICKLYGCVAYLDIHYLTSARINSFIETIKNCGMEMMCVICLGATTIMPDFITKLPNATVVQTIFAADNLTDKVNGTQYYRRGIAIEDSVFTTAISEEVHNWCGPVVAFVIDNKETARGYIANGADIVVSNSLTTLRD